MIGKLQVWAAGAIIALLFVSAIAGGAYLKGRDDEADKRDLAAANATIGAVRVNIESWTAADAETAALIARNNRLTGDLDNARRRIAAYNAPPPPGRVGRTALIDPGLGRVFVCSLEQLYDAAVECGGGAADGADEPAAHEPMPARASP